jgi:hypothetical protein
VAKETRKIHQVRRYGNEKRSDEGLALVEVTQSVNRIYEGNDGSTKECGQKPRDKVGLAEDIEHPGRDIVEERPVVHRVVDVGPLGQQFVGEPRVDGLIVVQQLEIEG